MHARTCLVFGITLAAISGSSPAHAYTEKLLHSFAGGSDGSFPVSNLIADQSGNLYGTTEYGGGACGNKDGCGTVFKLAPDGTEAVLYAFHNKSDGGHPRGGLLMDPQGNLYGTAFAGGGKDPCGTVFQITQAGVETVLHSFQCNTDGGNSVASLIADGAENFYGTTSEGGLSNCGTVFELTPEGVYNVLYTFQGTLNGGNDGAGPAAPLNLDTLGNLYGTTTRGGNTKCVGGGGCGTVFKLAPSGTETVLHVFQGGRDGTQPYGGLIMDTSGNLYGTTERGGGRGCSGSGCGTVFALAPDGTETVLAKFNRANGPEGPLGGVIMDGNISLFGTTAIGGAAGLGAAFKLAPGVKAKAIYSFAGVGAKDGSYPAGSLLEDASGNFYGTTESGGAANDGTVFVLKK